MRRVVRSGPTTTGFAGGAKRTAVPVTRVQSSLDTFLKPRSTTTFPMMIPLRPQPRAEPRAEPRSRPRPGIEYLEREAEADVYDAESSDEYSETSSDRRIAISVSAVTVVFTWGSGTVSSVVMATDTLETAAERAGLNMHDLREHKTCLSVGDQRASLDDPLEAFEPADDEALTRLEVNVLRVRKRKAVY